MPPRKKAPQSIFEVIRRNDVPTFLSIVWQRASALEETEEDNLRNTVLHVATEHGHNMLVWRIINLRPSLVSSGNTDGDTPLHFASRLGDTDIVTRMLESGWAVCTAANNQGQTALLFACHHKHLEAARLIMDKAKSFTVEEVNAAILSGYTDIARTILQKFPNLARKADKRHSTPLHCACDIGDPVITRMVLGITERSGKKVNSDGLIPLHLAVIRGSVGILKEFLEFDDARLQFYILTPTLETLFHVAARYKQTDAFIFIAGTVKKSHILRTDGGGNTVLHVAVSNACVPLVEYIISETEVPITSKNKSSFTALDLLDQDAEHYTLIYDLLNGNRRPKAAKAPTEVTEDEGETVLNSEAHVTIQKDAEVSEPLSAINLTTEIDSPANSTEDESRIGREKKQQRSKNKLEDDLLEHERTYYMQNKHKKQTRRNERIHSSRKLEIHLESLQNARNTITIVSVLIASVAFSVGINPPGGVFQDGPFIGKSTACTTTAFKVFAISNNIALLTSLCIVIILVSIIPHRRKPLVKLLVITHKMMWAAVGFMATAYVAAMWVIMPRFRGTKWLPYTILALTSCSLGALFIYLGYKLIKHLLKKKQTVPIATSSFQANKSSLRVSSIRTKDSTTSCSDVFHSEKEGYYIY